MSEIRTYQPTPEEYRREKFGEQKMIEGRVESHQLLERLKGKHPKVGVVNEVTHSAIIDAMKSGNEVTLKIDFVPSQPWMVQSFGVQKLEDLTDRTDTVGLLEEAATAESGKITIPMDQTSEPMSPTTMICHNHPNGLKGFSETDQDILQRSSDILHGVITTTDFEEFSVTAYDPHTGSVQPDHFRFGFVIAQDQEYTKNGLQVMGDAWYE